MATLTAKQRIAVAAAVYIIRKRRRYRRKRITTPRTEIMWGTEYFKLLEKHPPFHNLCKDLAEKNTFLRCFSLCPKVFYGLLNGVSGQLEKQNTRSRSALSPAERLTVTLRYLATGESYRRLAFIFRVGEKTIRKFVPETCAAIHSVLAEENMKCPSTPEEWTDIADAYLQRWDFPNCLGALDSKHIAIEPTPSAGNAETQTSSVVLTVLVDSQRRLLTTNVGYNGHISENNGQFIGAEIDVALEQQISGTPAPRPLPGNDEPRPFIMVTDEAFGLSSKIMKPFRECNLDSKRRIFNYRLLRARRVVENTLTILTSRFRILQNTIGLTPDKVEHVILACCAIHNLLQAKGGAAYTDRVLDKQDEKSNEEADNVKALRQAIIPQEMDTTENAEQCRMNLAEYFVTSHGAKSWQWDIL